jgi:hypothetical protein
MAGRAFRRLFRFGGVDMLRRTLQGGVVLLLLAASLAGCKSTTVVNEYRERPTLEMVEGDSIVILGRRHKSDHETEVDFVDCVGDHLGSSSDNVNVIPEQQFVDSMYPYFEASTAPMDVTRLDNLMQKPMFAKKVSDFHLRYFVWIDGYTETTDSSGSISCAVGPGGGGCFGFATWDDEASYEATIWDFKDLAMSGKISAETQGTSYLPAVIVPVPLLARVQANACKSMAEQITSFLEQ